MRRSFDNQSPKEIARIKVDDDAHLNYWAKELGVSKRTLKDAVRAAGPIAVDVRRRLRTHPRGLDVRGR